MNKQNAEKEKAIDEDSKKVSDAAATATATAATTAAA